MEERLWILESEAAIRRLVARHHWNNDAGSETGEMPPWHDIVASTKMAAPAAGVKPAASWRGKGLSPAWPQSKTGFIDCPDTPRQMYMPRMMHFLTNEDIKVDKETATGRWYCFEPAVVNVRDRLQAIWIVGRITCNFDFEGGAWQYRDVEYEEVFSTSFSGEGWLAEPHIQYGPLAVEGSPRHD
ncbi:nuclear transport factor 2 family protein [Mesorhizobium sp. DCY119]|uniref:nuclear transport factor 2 family protein n=1 Tax=Mesorhizobium sp. DCY119 TaxID=2108445 RepID=UPI0014031927|nr:nuclear transport factor 2 family protein [Mesorhizobium sp. DCY119]